MGMQKRAGVAADVQGAPTDDPCFMLDAVAGEPAEDSKSIGQPGCRRLSETEI